MPALSPFCPMRRTYTAETRLSCQEGNSRLRLGKWCCTVRAPIFLKLILSVSSTSRILLRVTILASLLLKNNVTPSRWMSKYIMHHRMTSRWNVYFWRHCALEPTLVPGPRVGRQDLPASSAVRILPARPLSLL